MSLRDNLNVLGKTKKSTKLYVKREISVPIKNESTKIGEDGKESVVNTSYKIKFIDSARFMASALSNLADNFAEEFIKLHVKIVIVSLNMKVSRTIWWNIYNYLVIKIIQTSSMKN